MTDATTDRTTDAMTDVPAPSRPRLTPEEVRRFAFRQGPGKAHLGEQHLVDDAAPTTSALPPRHARSATGRPLPLGTCDLLAATSYPQPCDRAAVAGLGPDARLGHLLVGALGLQRREPSHRYADHRAVPSGRAKFPVHAFTAQGPVLRYLDVHRHALVDVHAHSGSDAPDALNAVAGEGGSVLLAARYSDLPAAYGRMRYAVSEAELGVSLRSLCVTADLLGIPARLALDGSATARAESAIRSAGPGTWSAPLTLRLGDPGDPDGPAPSVPLPGPPGPEHDARDPLLAAAALDPSVRDAAAVSAQRHALPAADPPTAHGLPAAAAAPAHRPDWARVLWDRSAGRAADRHYGFSLRPAALPGTCLTDLLAWARQPPPDRLLAEVARRLRLTVALHRVGGRPDGLHRVEEDGLTLHRRHPRIMAVLQAGFAQPPSHNTDNGVRHAAMVWIHSIDVDALVDDLGPAALGLLQLCLGWSVHGLCLGAAAHGLVARPARSFVEYRVQPLLGLARQETPVFMTICGTSRFTEPMLDLRT